MVNYGIKFRCDCLRVEKGVQGLNFNSFWMIKLALQNWCRSDREPECAEFDWDSPGAMRTALLVTLLINQHLLKHLMDFNFYDCSTTGRMQHMNHNWLYEVWHQCIFWQSRLQNLLRWFANVHIAMTTLLQFTMKRGILGKGIKIGLVIDHIQNNDRTLTYWVTSCGYLYSVCFSLGVFASAIFQILSSIFLNSIKCYLLLL